MKEVLFKFIFFTFLLSLGCFTKDVPPKSYDYVFNNYVPLDLSQNNLGVYYSFKNHESFFSTHNWISNNLYIGGYLGSNKNDKLLNSFNIGYKTNINFIKNCNVVYDFSLSRIKNFESIKNKWKKISIIFDFEIINLSYSYLTSKCTDEDIETIVKGCINKNDYKNSYFLGFNLYKRINDAFLIDFGFKKTKIDINPFLSLRYNL